jgi:O-acetyl-ADP-ribose deacetylase (regulator of RNase III)
MIDILYILQATVKLSLKIEESESIEAKKKIEKLRKDGVHITSDEQTNQVECEGTEAQVATARQVHTVKDGLCFTTKEGIRIYVYCAAIEHLEVDVVVNAANKDLQHEGIAYHISRAAGYDFDKECDDYIRDHGPLDVGSCCLTTAGKLPYHSIIHAVGPMWHSYPHDGKQKCLDDLKMTILSTLLKTDRHHYKSIAIPSISSGKYLQ